MEEIGIFAGLRGWRPFLDLDHALNLQPMSYRGEFPLRTDPERRSDIADCLLSLKWQRTLSFVLFDPGLIQGLFGLCSAFVILSSSIAE
jgi:hypothetical protein